MHSAFHKAKHQNNKNKQNKQKNKKLILFSGEAAARGIVAAADRREAVPSAQSARRYERSEPRIARRERNKKPLPHRRCEAVVFLCSEAARPIINVLIG
jgi:hypothetical protein